MPIGLKGNTDGSGAIQIGGSDAISISTGLVATGSAGNLMLISSTSVPSTSGTSIDFTNIPSWVKRITVIFSGVSLSSTANLLVRVGSGSFSTTGYLSHSGILQSSAVSSTTSTSGYVLNTSGATSLTSGSLVLVTPGANIWNASGIAFVDAGTDYSLVASGTITLSGTLDRVQVTSTSTDTFDAGSINILYE